MSKIKSLVLAGSLLFALNSQARLSCDELDELAEAVDDVAYEFDRMNERDMDRSTDRALKELTEALSMVAEYENDRRLMAWTADLEIAWEDMEKDDFIESLDDISERLDELYYRDCGR